MVWSPRVLWGIGITGFLSLALAFAIQAWAQQFTPATHTALIFTLEPVFAWLTSFIFLGERLGGRAGLGAACILAGLLISEEKASAESMAVSPDHAAVPASTARATAHVGAGALARPAERSSAGFLVGFRKPRRAAQGFDPAKASFARPPGRGRPGLHGEPQHFSRNRRLTHCDCRWREGIIDQADNIRRKSL